MGATIKGLGADKEGGLSIKRQYACYPIHNQKCVFKAAYLKENRGDKT
jgi:hypothetical protein